MKKSFRFSNEVSSLIENGMDVYHLATDCSKLVSRCIKMCLGQLLIVEVDVDGETLSYEILPVHLKGVFEADVKYRTERDRVTGRLVRKGYSLEVVNKSFKEVVGEVNSVNLREIHAYLDVVTKFNDWAKERIDGFEEGVDYITILKKEHGNDSNGLPVYKQYKEYIVTLLNNLKSPTSKDEAQEFIFRRENNYINATLISEPETGSPAENETLKVMIPSLSALAIEVIIQCGT
jgi:hypothetical protein